MVDGEATVKRLTKKKEKYILSPENPGFNSIVITEKDAAFQILGKVVAVIHLHAR